MKKLFTLLLLLLLLLGCATSTTHTGRVVGKGPLTTQMMEIPAPRNQSPTAIQTRRVPGKVKLRLLAEEGKPNTQVIEVEVTTKEARRIPLDTTITFQELHHLFWKDYFFK